MRRFRPTYANVVSTIALVLAASGTAWAAGSPPPASVGTRELRDSSIRSVDVRNGTLRREDFRSGTLLRGPRGAAGRQGTSGEAGATGADGSERPSRLRRRDRAGRPSRRRRRGGSQRVRAALSSGEVVHGVLGGRTDPGSSLALWISLPAPTSTALDLTHVTRRSVSTPIQRARAAPPRRPRRRARCASTTRSTDELGGRSDAPPTEEAVVDREAYGHQHEHHVDQDGWGCEPNDLVPLASGPGRAAGRPDGLKPRQRHRRAVDEVR